ncbi:MAG TPA: zf-HC2 domain-containing protein [Pyrinomonadaceae bacterium]
MNERKNSPDCERAPDLIAFLYNEADEHEARDFQLHLQECSRCRDELASFGAVRESVTAWRDEALSGFVSSPVVTKPSRKSALAALRQFFDLSPLWLKGATALAAVLFCVLVGLAIVRRENNQVSKVNSDAKYTQQDVDRMVKEALARQENAKPPVETVAGTTETVKPSKPKISRTATPSQLAKSRRPLSKAEREQLAAELRLSGADATINLIGDRINQ